MTRLRAASRLGAGRSRGRRDRGATLIEILVSLVILLVGLLGLVGLMIQSQRAQVESYQRVQALMMVQDMAARIQTNRAVATCYTLAAAVGTGNTTIPTAAECTVGTAAQRTRMEKDYQEWLGLLRGTSEKMDAGATDVGSVIGARGCVTRDAVTGIYLVSVAWQGLSDLGAPPASVTCGQGQYGGESRRRAVSVTLLPSSLT
jgi:type IV pilus assembly protein PilV